MLVDTRRRRSRGFQPCSSKEQRRVLSFVPRWAGRATGSISVLAALYGLTGGMLLNNDSGHLEQQLHFGCDERSMDVLDTIDKHDSPDARKDNRFGAIDAREVCHVQCPSRDRCVGGQDRILLRAAYQVVLGELFAGVVAIVPPLFAIRNAFWKTVVPSHNSL